MEIKKQPWRAEKMKSLIIIIFSLVIGSHNTYTQTKAQKIKPSSEWTHPELKPGEIWLTNISTTQYYKDGLFWSCADCALGINFNQIVYKSKRLGNVAYSIYGNEVKYMRPVFVSRKEYNNRYKVSNVRSM